MGNRLVLGIVIFFGGLAGITAGEVTLPDPLKVGSAEYRGTIFLSKDDAYVKFSHAEGISRVEIASLPRDVREALGYNEELAQAQLAREQQRKAAEAAAAAPKAAPIIIHGRLVKNTAKGLLVSVRQSAGKKQVAEWTRDGSREEMKEEEIFEDVFYLVRGNPNAEFLRDGNAIDYVVIPLGPDSCEGREAMAVKFVRVLD